MPFNEPLSKCGTDIGGAPMGAWPYTLALAGRQRAGQNILVHPSPLCRGGRMA
ncbi:MAG: hypothetical protein QOE41_2302, partial [Mycobacterium sp.]|nr:hypothetical protein [Mycobacterium sp.]